MQAPDFWTNPPERPGIIAQALKPLGALYGFLTRRRLGQSGYQAKVPVICVGNINVGGTGKTPTVILLLQMLQDQRKSVHVVSRGYGGTLAGPVLVDPRHHTARDVGDEPLLLSAFAPVWVVKNRAEGVRAAERAGAEVVVLDDGFQNPSVVKDFCIVVVDAAVGFGNGLVMPAGPLREPVRDGLQRADLVLSIGDDAAQSSFKALWGSALSVPHLKGTLTPLETGMDWTDTPFLAFAGIGRPEKFFATLRSLGATLVHAEPLSDHQTFTPSLMRRLETDAHRLGAQLVTTEKDAVRLPDAFRQKVITLPVRLVLENDTALTEALGLLSCHAKNQL
jgi:tetraacyldisaccharide 4'-kinase